ncbi:MAG: RNA polymerase sigma-70 factor (ECF subfamily) [Planctomycetota bacterium]|jgi:RNA polymerase sigma-70 factor (ECF subfamily)
MSPLGEVSVFDLCEYRFEGFMTQQPENTPQLSFTDTLYASLCQLAEGALKSHRHTVILPAELVHECFLKLLNSNVTTPSDPIEFRALASTMIRNALVDRVRQKKSQKRGEGWVRVAAPEEHKTDGLNQFDVLVLDEALLQLAELDPRQARIVELRFFGGLSIPEIAENLKVSARTVSADWTIARAWLRRALS